jgi:hypothetical protein
MGGSGPPTRDDRRPDEEKDRMSDLKQSNHQPDRPITPTLPESIPEKPKQPARKRKKPTASVHEGPEFYTSVAPSYGARLHNSGNVRKDSLGRVMNPARAGSVTSVAVAGGRDDGSVGSGAKATEPVGVQRELSTNEKEV